MRVALSAGGTGGHLFLAEALASVLAARGHLVTLLTDRRATGLLKNFSADTTHFLPAATPSVKNPVRFARAAAVNALALGVAARVLRSERPDVIVGFGGYPTVPPLVAARLLRIPAIVHEANAVIGRANKRLAKGAHVATSFPHVRGLGEAPQTQVGIPVRPSVVAAAKPYSPANGGGFRLLVFGGSQGARVFADMMPPAVAALQADERARLSIVHQARPEDRERVVSAYRDMDVHAQVQPFFADLPERIANAHLVVSRSGASTVAELAVIGRPAILVPLPGALDQDQAHNASALAETGAAWRLDQDCLTPDRLADELSRAMANPAELASAADKARAFAQPDAAERLADLTERMAR